MANTGATYTPIGAPEQSTGPNATQNLASTLLSGAEPTIASSQLQYNLGAQQQGLVNTNLAETNAYNQAMTGYQQGSLGISNQQIGLQKTGLQEQGQQAAAQQGFEQQGYNIQQGQYPEQQAEAALAYQNALRSTQGGQAISGTQNTVGGRADVSTLAQNYGFQQQDINRAQQLSQLGQQSELSGYGYSQEQLQNAQKNLGLSAQANGISQQQLYTMLGYQNQQAGLSAQGQSQQIQAGQESDLINILANAGPALSQLGMATNLNATAGIPLNAR